MTMVDPTRSIRSGLFTLLVLLFSAPLTAAGQSITEFVLVDAAANSDLQALSDGDVVQVDDLPTSELSVRAVPGGSVESVRFSFAGNTNYQTENVTPYALNGDSNGDYDSAPELTQTGSYTLRATPYSGPDAGGTEGSALEISFTVESGTTPPEGCAADGTEPPQVVGVERRWHPITVVIDGPCSTEDASPNPFLNYRLSVTFTHDATGTTVTVPGYFAADGNAANTSATSGTKWHAHFTPRQTGSWSFETSFRQGTNVAISLDENAGSPTSYDGQTGNFSVGPTNKTGRDHRGKGILRRVDGQRYLQFDDGSYFLKGGADSPENLLAYTDFDGTFSDGGRSNSVRDYNHTQDWNAGDPTWKNGKGKGLIGALNYLASEEMTAFSFLTMNVTGDGDDVWPWTGPSNKLRYDVSKLAQWEIVLRHSDTIGLFKHFKTQETENDGYLDGGDLGTERKLYYRELVARFAHHHALNWNLGEEFNAFNNASNQTRLKNYADYITALDPYDHPIVVHTFPGQLNRVYGPLLGFENFDGPSIQLSQMSDTDASAAVQTWLTQSANAGQIWNVSVDEPGNAQAGLRPDSDDNHDAAREVLWSVLFGGGDGLEWYFGYAYPDDDLDADDWRSRDRFWDYHRYALDLMRQLPFTTMEAQDDRLGGEDGYVFSDGLEVFAVYLKDGGTGTTLDLPDGTFNVQWFDPRNGGSLQAGSIAQVNGGTDTAIGSPPSNNGQDWVAVASRPDNPIPVELSSLEAETGSPGTVQLRWTTASETNNAGFDILHRTPTGASFQSLGFVEGAGTTSSPRSYRYPVDNLSPGTHTFRLRQVDVDGTASLTDTVAVTLTPETDGFLSRPTPSPSRGQTRISLSVQRQQTVEVALYDVMGRRVRTVYDGEATAARPVRLTVSTGDLAPGMYFLRASGEAFSAVRKISVVQ